MGRAAATASPNRPMTALAPPARGGQRSNANSISPWQGRQGRAARGQQADQKWTIARINAQGRARMAQVASDRSSDWQGLGVSILHRLVVDGPADSSHSGLVGANSAMRPGRAAVDLSWQPPRSDRLLRTYVAGDGPRGRERRHLVRATSAGHRPDGSAGWRPASTAAGKRLPRVAQPSAGRLRSARRDSHRVSGLTKPHADLGVWCPGRERDSVLINGNEPSTDHCQNR